MHKKHQVLKKNFFRHKSHCMPKFLKSCFYSFKIVSFARSSSSQLLDMFHHGGFPSHNVREGQDDYPFHSGLSLLTLSTAGVSTALQMHWLAVQFWQQWQPGKWMHGFSLLHNENLRLMAVYWLATDMARSRWSSKCQRPTSRGQTHDQEAPVQWAGPFTLKEPASFIFRHD